jgi:hypothetical protein
VTEHSRELTPDVVLSLAIEVLKQWDKATPGSDWMPSTRMMNTVPHLIALLERARLDLDTYARLDVVEEEVAIAHAVVGVKQS